MSYRHCFGILLTLAVSAVPVAAQSSWDRYKPGSVGAIIAQEREGVLTQFKLGQGHHTVISGASFPTRGFSLGGGLPTRRSFATEARRVAWFYRLSSMPMALSSRRLSLSFVAMTSASSQKPDAGPRAHGSRRVASVGALSASAWPFRSTSGLVAESDDTGLPNKRLKLAGACK